MINGVHQRIYHAPGDSLPPAVQQDGHMISDRAPVIQLHHIDRHQALPSPRVIYHAADLTMRYYIMFSTRLGITIRMVI